MRDVVHQLELELVEFEAAGHLSETLLEQAFHFHLLGQKLLVAQFEFSVQFCGPTIELILQIDNFVSHFANLQVICVKGGQRVLLCLGDRFLHMRNVDVKAFLLKKKVIDRGLFHLVINTVGKTGEGAERHETANCVFD